MSDSVDERLMDRSGSIFKAIIACLSIIGVIMVYSASYMYAKERFGNSGHYFIRQSLFLLIGIAFAFIISKTKYNFWVKYSFHINLCTTVLLLLTFVPGIGATAKGANRWLYFAGFSLQPGELIKYSILLSSINFFEKFEKMELKEIIIHLGSILFPLFLLVLQPDFGTFSICFAVVSFACYLSIFPRRYFYSCFFSGIVIGSVILISQPYRVRRLTTFLDPWKNARGSGFQIIQSWIGFSNGGFLGMGPGNSIEKLFYLPEAHNDFIFSVIGEEFGFVGVLALVCLFISLLYFGLKMALEVKSRMAFMVISSIVFTISIQSLLNMGVVLGLLPTKGLNLPLISYGGSSIVANFCAIGLIFSAYKDYRSEDNVSGKDNLSSFQSYNSRASSEN